MGERQEFRSCRENTAHGYFVVVRLAQVWIVAFRKGNGVH